MRGDFELNLADVMEFKRFLRSGLICLGKELDILPVGNGLAFSDRLFAGLVVFWPNSRCHQVKVWRRCGWDFPKLEGKRLSGAGGIPALAALDFGNSGCSVRIRATSCCSGTGCCLSCRCRLWRRELPFSDAATDDTSYNVDCLGDN